VFIEAKLVEQYLADLDAEPAERAPRFDYLIFYSSRYDYYYPKQHEKFTPVRQLGFEISSGRSQHMRAHRQGIFNRYRNSVHWVDQLVGRVIRKLEKLGRFDDAVIVVTGDHGEEFWEQGRFGHTFGVSNEQIQTGTAVHFPGGLRTRQRVSSHADLFPTIFDRMGLNRELDTFMTGKSLARHDSTRDLAVSATATLVVKSDKFVVSGPKLKIRFSNTDQLEADRILRADDGEPESVDLDEARTLLRAVLNEKRIAGAPNLGL